MLNAKFSACWTCYSLDPLLAHATYKTQPPSKGVFFAPLKLSLTMEKQVKHFALKPQLFPPKTLAFLTKYDCFKFIILFKLKTLASYNC